MEPWLKKTAELTSDELAALSEADAEARRETELLERVLGMALAVDVPFDRVEALAATRRRAARRMSSWVVVPAVAAAAALTLAVGFWSTDPGWRHRGRPGRPEFAVEVAAEGLTGVRALPAQGKLGSDERAVFLISTRSPGRLRVVDQRTGDALFPSEGFWSVPSGSHAPMQGGKVLGYTPDRGGTDATLEFQFCVGDTDDSRCDSQVIRLEWAGP